MPAQPATTATPAVVHRLRLACFAAGITLLVFSQSSGAAAPDTKLDLVVAPGRFLAAALRMWDPRAAAGQMQDQAYGYLFPMGPAFWLGKVAALSPWVVQRGWESALLVAAFLGVVRLARLLGVAGFWPRVAAGLAYALAPRMLMEIGVISAELVPAAVLPWVLIPLVRGAAGGSPRRAAAKSGVALLFAGGINAAATVAILPVPILWLITRSAGPRRRALAVWWAVATACACLWWAVPLLVLGKYSPPFLDWIESSQVTTGPTSLLAVLRGADHWQAYLGPSEWPAGWILVAAPATILATTGVAAVGLAGLARPRTPHRLFLLVSLLVGLILVTLGHVATVGPVFGESVRHLLDGPLNAFRNVHKFDPVLRLPVAIGVGHAIGALVARWPQHIRIGGGGGSFAVHGRTVLVVALGGLAAIAVSPALAGRLVPAPRQATDPSWWAQAGVWLGKHEGLGRALVVPGAAQPVYLWGAPRDDALQPYADGPWTVRDAAPLVQPGYVRLLDTFDALLASGSAQPALAPLLARAGIRYLVVRNDLDSVASHTTPLRFVHETIAASPGLRRVAGFGQGLGQGADPNRLVDLGMTTTSDAVDVYENTAWRGEVSLLPASGAVVAGGSADSLANLVRAGLAPTTPVIFGAAPAAVAAAGLQLRNVVTDGIRRREFGFGGIANYSETMTAHQPFSVPRAAHDYLPDPPGPLTTAAYLGIADVRASSSASDPTGLFYRGPAYSPWAALDNDLSTAWFSASPTGGVGQWYGVALSAPASPSTVQLRFPRGLPAYPTRLRVSTDAGSLVADVSPSADPQEVPLPSGMTRFVRFTVLDMTSRGAFDQFAIANLVLPGIHATRTLEVPAGGTPDALVFAVATGHRSACLDLSGAAACDASWAVRGEEDSLLSRQFVTAGPAVYQIQARVRFVPGANTDALLDAGNPIRAIASSVQAGDPRERAGAAVDGDPATGWVAAPGDKAPTLSMRLPARRVIDGLRLVAAPHAPASRPTQLLVHAGDRAFTAGVAADGTVRFPAPVRTASISITVVRSSLRISTDSLTNVARLLPVGIGEVVFEGPHAPTGIGAGTVTLGCSAGLAMYVDNQRVALRVSASASDVLAGRPVPALPCTAGGTALGAGRHLVALGSDARTAPESITMTKAGSRTLAATSPTPGSIEPLGWGATSRAVRVATDEPAFLVVRENANAGWRASLDGRSLPPVTLDGWQQGWLLPAGAHGTVLLRFAPQRAVDWGLIAGALAVALLLVGALARGRPRRPAGLRDATLPRLAGPPLGVGAGVLLGGVGGAAVAGLAWLGLLALRRRSMRLPFWTGSAVLFLAGAVEAAAPAGSADPLAGSTGVQLLCLVALGLVVAGGSSGATPWPGEPAKHRPLEQVPARRGRSRRGERREQPQLDEMPAEGAPAEPSLDRDEQR